MGILHLVAIPIGNPMDITLRALEILEQTDAVICEEIRPAETILKRHGIKKPLYPLNEHNESEAVGEYIKLIKESVSVCLISDCGTPAFMDPGAQLVKMCRRNKIRVTALPGASSLMATLALSGLKLRRFYFAGFPPQEKTERRKFLHSLSVHKCPIVLADTPYRLKSLLTELQQIFPSASNCVLCMSLTKPDEKVITGSPKLLLGLLEQHKKLKAEFILIIDR